LGRRRELSVPSIVLDRISRVPLHRQIHRQIAECIRGGAIHDQARLPSTRLLARLLGVSRNTVLAAYDDLAADGLIRGETGAGMRVNGTVPSRSGMFFGLGQVIRSANYPARVLEIADPDENPIYLNF
jgi:DNA-binding GntR family transcriptional regulator